MNPPGYPAEAFPLQGVRHDMPPGQPAGSTTIQYTTVSVTTEPPKDHIIWSLCCFAYSNLFCLGLAALIFSIKARDRKVAGDMEGARYYGFNARCLNIASTVLVVIFIITIIALYVHIYRYRYRY